MRPFRCPVLSMMETEGKNDFTHPMFLAPFIVDGEGRTPKQIEGFRLGLTDRPILALGDAKPALSGKNYRQRHISMLIFRASNMSIRVATRSQSQKDPLAGIL